MNALISDFCFLFPKFQVGLVAFDGNIYYIFIYDTVCSPKPFQRFWKAALFVFYSQNPEIALW